MTIAELSEYLRQKAVLSPLEEEQLQKDQRRGTRALLDQYHKRREKNRREAERLQQMLAEEKILWSQGLKQIAGIDEAGRGPLSGPVVAAAVILKPENLFSGLNDSKQLSAAVRKKLFDQIIEESLAYGIGSASRAEIDQLNIHSATLLAMTRALERLTLKPDYLLIDGFLLKKQPLPQKAIPGGDATSLSIAAASVLAKVTRDQIMLALHQKYPQYGFDRNMGYGTAEHREALNRFGPCPEHRRSFRLDYF